MKTFRAFFKAIGVYLETLLFDFTFQRYISLQIIPLVYLLIVFATASALAYGVALAFLYDLRFGVAALILAPPTFLVWVSVCRVVLELLMVVFRMAGQLDEVGAMRESVDKLSGLGDVARPLARLFRPASIRERNNTVPPVNNQRR